MMSVRKRPQTLMEEDSLHSYKKLATQSQSITRHLEPNLYVKEISSLRRKHHRPRSFDMLTS